MEAIQFKTIVENLRPYLSAETLQLISNQQESKEFEVDGIKKPVVFYGKTIERPIHKIIEERHLNGEEITAMDIVREQDFESFAKDINKHVDLGNLKYGTYLSPFIMKLADRNGRKRIILILQAFSDSTAKELQEKYNVTNFAEEGVISEISSFDFDPLKFAEWTGNNFIRLASVWVHKSEDPHDESKWITTEKLLDMFKSERRIPTDNQGEI